MSVENRKLKVWGCLVCKSLKNNRSEKRCPTCGAKREPDRYVVLLLDAYYLCHVNTARAFPQVTITRLSPPESTITVKLPVIRETLLDAVREAVSNSTSASSSATSVSRPSGDDNVGAERSDNKSQDQGQRLDLYHKVMSKAKDLEYDVVMGQFVPAGAANSPNGSVQHKDLKYVQSMKKEKDAMDKIVKSTILSREEGSPHTKTLNVNEDSLNEWKAKVPCALCGHLFPPAQLLGNISNHSILNWMKEHQVPTDSKECKKMLLQAYEAAKMCLFCTQFFDENYADTFDVEISANEEFRSRRNENKKHHKTVSKEDKAIEKLNEKLAIAELKAKKEALGVRARGGAQEEEVSSQSPGQNIQLLTAHYMLCICNHFSSLLFFLMFRFCC
jgi:hypothetical protein